MISKKRQVVSKKVVDFTKSYLESKNVKEYYLGDLIRDFYKERSIKFEVLKKEYRESIKYKNGYYMSTNFYEYNDRCYKLLRDGGLNIIVKGRKRVIIL
jgi:hypothetical protein